MKTETTSQDLIPALNAELIRVFAQRDGEGLTVEPSINDFTVVHVFDNQEQSLISIDTANDWFLRLQKLEANAGFENAYRELTSIKNWEIQA